MGAPAFLVLAASLLGAAATTQPDFTRLASDRLLAGRCGAAADRGGGVGSPSSTLRVEGPVWRVEALSGQDANALAAARPGLSVRFEAGRVEGFSGCNRFAGSYTLEADRIHFGPLAGTLMACGEPATALENAFRSVLAGAPRFALAEGRLSLTADSGTTASLREAPAPNLEGVAWEVTGYNNGREAIVSPQLGTALSLSFEDGEVTGSSGCNSFHASYTQEGNRISVGPLATTRKHCTGEGVMEQEREFLAALAAARTWSIRDELLDMHFEDGARALTARPK